MKAKASICISTDDTLVQSLELAKARIQIMINKGMENSANMLQDLIDLADNATYFAEIVIDLDLIDEPMIADPDVNNEDVSKRYVNHLCDENGPITFNSPLVVAPLTYNIVDELKAEGDWDVLAKYAGFTFDDSHPKEAARTKYENCSSPI